MTPRLLIAALTLFWACSAQAQMGQIPNVAQLVPAPSGGCSPGTAATNFLARTSGLSGTETTAYCNLINGLVTDGIITGNLSGAAGCGSVLDALYIVATNNTTTAALNLCGTSFSLVTHGTLTFTADVGYTGDGSTGYLDTQWTPNGNGVNFTLNSGSIGAYIQTNGAGTSNTDMMGTGTGGSTYTRFQPNNSGNFLWDINGNSFPTATNANVQGAWVVARSSSTTTTVYKNGSTTFASSSSDSSGSMSTVDMTFFAVAGSSNFSNYQASAFFMSAGLTSTQAFALNNRINAFMSALGHNIY